MDESELSWKAAQASNGWQLPEPASKFFRLPIIRNFRAAWLRLKIERHYAHGLGSIGIRTGYDDWVVYAIYRGWC